MHCRACLLLFLCLSAVSSATSSTCAHRLVYADRTPRVVLSAEVGARFRQALDQAGCSVDVAAQKMGVTRRFVMGALGGKYTLSEAHFQALLALLPPAAREEFPLEDTQAERPVRAPLRDGVSQPLGGAQFRLLASYRANYAGSDPALAKQLGISYAFVRKIFAGEAKSVRNGVFDKLMELLRIQTSIWNRAAALTLQSDLPETGYQLHRQASVLYASYSDPKEWGTDLFSLAVFAGARGTKLQQESALDGFLLRVRGWYLRRMGAALGLATHDQIVRAEVFTQQARLLLPELDLRLPVSETLEKLFNSPPVTESVAPDEVPGPTAPERSPRLPDRDWDKVFSEIDTDSLQVLKEHLPEYFIPTRAFRVLWRREMQNQALSGLTQNRLLGLGKPRIASLKADEAFHLTRDELVNLVALLGLPLQSTVRMATEYEIGADDDRVALTRLFRAVVKAHKLALNIHSTKLHAAMGCTDRSLYFRIVSGEAVTVPRGLLKKLVEKLEITPLAVRALLGPEFICDPSLETERCQSVGMEVGAGFVSVVTYRNTQHALEDLVLLSAKLQLFPAESQRLRAEFTARWLPLVWSGVKNKLHYPLVQRERLAIKRLREELKIALSGRLLFTSKNMLEDLKALTQDAIRFANERAASDFPEPSFRYD